jgi:serine protease Do
MYLRIRENNMFREKSSFVLFIVLLFSLLGSSVSLAEDGGIASLRQTSKAFASVAKQVSPSVVLIQVESVQKGAPVTPFQSPFGDDLFKRFFGEDFPGFQNQPQPESRVMGQGSGFVFSVKKGILSDTTYILTNNHVVKGADKIRVTFLDGKEYAGKVTGADPKSDIAIVEIKDNSHSALKMGDSSNLEVGEWVIAVGNPFGLSHTITVGVVSAKGRSGLGINDYEDFIQTDAAINPGNSGGPLLNLEGEVVGINTAIFSRSGGYMGVGFAIPMNLAQNIADQLIDRGEVTRGYLGVVIQSLTPELAESFDIKDGKGILVAQVSKDSPAEKAGLKVGDLIVRYQGKDVTDVSDFRNRVALTSPGSKAVVTIIRNGKHKTINLKIGNLEDKPQVARSSTQQADELGLTVQTITPDLAQQFDVSPGQGVVVTEVKRGSVSAMAGIRPGTVILKVNRIDVNTGEEFMRAVEKSRKSKRVLLLLSDRGMSRYVVLSWR